MPRVTVTLPLQSDSIDALLEGLTRLNRVLMEQRPARYPLIYGSGIRYVREEYPNGPGEEHWQNANELVEARIGDCEDLAAYRAAELRLLGWRKAKAFALYAGVGIRGRTYHVLVDRRGRGQEEDWEDVSARLGAPQMFVGIL